MNTDVSEKLPNLKLTWTAEEDSLLRHLVTQVGPKRWSTIARYMNNGRTAVQCSKRWLNTLSPDIVQSVKNSQVEDEFILYMHDTIGKKWADMARLLNGKTPENIKNRFNALSKSRSNSNATFETISISDLHKFIERNPVAARTGFVSRYLSSGCSYLELSENNRSSSNASVLTSSDVSREVSGNFSSTNKRAKLFQSDYNDDDLTTASVSEYSSLNGKSAESTETMNFTNDSSLQQSYQDAAYLKYVLDMPDEQVSTNVLT